MFLQKQGNIGPVLSVFIDAYNKYGEAKQRHQISVVQTSTKKHLHKYRDMSFSVLGFL